MGSCCTYTKMNEDTSTSENSTVDRLSEDMNEYVRILKNAALAGDINKEIPPLSRIIRLFISSTFKDMAEERNLIMEKIYSKLESYCANNNYILQIVDLRWGIFETSIDEQQTGDICLAEVDLAKKVSNGPCFIAILSHRYGTICVPRTIPEIEFNNLNKACNNEEKRLLNEWYLLDENNIPPVRVLKPLKNEDLKKQWTDSANQKLNAIFEKLSDKCFKDETLKELSTKSITEIEIKKGIFETKDSSVRCLVFFRNFNCFQSIETVKANANITDSLVQTYLDTTDDTINYKSFESVEKLKNSISEHLPMENIIQFDLSLDLNNKNDRNQDEFNKYILEFSESVFHHIKGIIEENLNKNKLLFDLFNNEYSDLFHHLRFCRAKIETFKGRDSYLVRIRNLLESNRKVIVVQGVSGSGKTSLSAKVASELRNWFPNTSLTLVLRFIGTSQDSYSIQSVLSSIIRQLSKKYNVKINYEKMWPISALYNYFKKFLFEVSKSNANDCIIILLDSLDQLSPEYDGRKLEWFPKEMPENIKFLVSTLTNPEYEAYPSLRKLVCDEDVYIQLSDLNNMEIQQVVDSNFKEANRTLTRKQMKGIQKLFKTCSNPLYMKLVLDQALAWRSFDQDDFFMFKGETAFAIVQSLFEHVERAHGEIYVKSVFRYITLSRHGFFENYLQDILSNDDEVRAYLKQEFKYSELPSRIPQIFLIRLINSLKNYISGPMYRWYHRMFQDTALKRYCNETYRASNERCHSIIVKTFINERLGKNEFWIKELPYHATCSNNIDSLKRLFLLDLKFMQNKIKVSNMDDLINDYQFAINNYFKNDETFEILLKTLIIAAYKIRESPLELPGQLYGRLFQFNKCKELQTFLEKCLIPPQASIIPNKLFMASPCNLLSQTIAAHKSDLKSIIISNSGNEIITCGGDNLIKVFSSEDYSLKNTIYKRYDSTVSLLISPDDSIIYAFSKIQLSNNEPVIEAFSLSNGSRLFEIEKSEFEKGRQLPKYRFLLFNMKSNELWLLTKDIWYKIDWKTGMVSVKDKMPESFSTQSDEYIAAVVTNNRLICVLDILPIVVSMDIMGGEKTVRDLKEHNVTGRQLLELNNNTVALSIRRNFESIYDKSEEMEWHIIICDSQTLNTLKLIPISKSLNMWRCALDNKTFYCRAFNYIYIIDIEKAETLYILEHSSQLSSCCALNDSIIFTSTFDNKFNIWNLNDAYPSTTINLFNTFNYRFIRFMYNDVNTRSRYGLFYNLFDNKGKELMMLYDIKQESVVTTVELERFDRNDLKPVTFLNNNFIVIYCRSDNLYYIVSMDKFRIHKVFNCDEKKVFKRNENQIVLSIKEENKEKPCLVLFDSDTFEVHYLIDEWHDVEYFIENKKFIIFKRKEADKIQIFEFETRDSWYFDLDLDKIVNGIISSEYGTYCAITSKDNNLSSIYVYKIDLANRSVLKCYEKIGICKLFNVSFVNELILLHQHKIDNDRLTWAYDLKVKNEYLWFKDDDRSDKLGEFDCLSHEKSKYIWYQRYQVSRMNTVKHDLTVYLKDDISKPYATLDVDCRLKVKQIALIDEGDAVISKEYDKLSFVMFFLRSEINKTNELDINFDSSIVETHDQKIVWTREYIKV